MIKSRAAVAFEKAKSLTLVELDVAEPKAGEVLVRIVATGVCHTDAYTLSGDDPEGIFPTVLGHEGAGIVEAIGAGVTSVTVGDHVIPLYTPECGACKFCKSGKTNLCQAIRATQGKGLMPDGTRRSYHSTRDPGGVILRSSVGGCPDVLGARWFRDRHQRVRHHGTAATDR